MCKEGYFKKYIQGGTFKEGYARKYIQGRIFKEGCARKEGRVEGGE